MLPRSLPGVETGEKGGHAAWMAVAAAVMVPVVVAYREHAVEPFNAT
jgi:hypothetical protein